MGGEERGIRTPGRFPVNGFQNRCSKNANKCSLWSGEQSFVRAVFNDSNRCIAEVQGFPVNGSLSLRFQPVDEIYG